MQIQSLTSVYNLHLLFSSKSYTAVDLDGASAIE